MLALVLRMVALLLREEAVRDGGTGGTGKEAMGGGPLDHQTIRVAIARRGSSNPEKLDECGRSMHSDASIDPGTSLRTARDQARLSRGWPIALNAFSMAFLAKQDDGFPDEKDLLK